ncbi:hypothetical protein [uncultured Cohaesibacter sp.]|uniref:hypothetical protein n=1 Tax=uncultured Cohaesibacter sp. TaxID=1002546 RepID=UPI0029C9766A|nr:hypothetical protein [uncultured Cohaesibacter sp.]
MATLTKTQLMVATGILICVLGLTFIAVSGTSALSDGYGTPLSLSNSSLTMSFDSNACIAVKGAQGCV